MARRPGIAYNEYVDEDDRWIRVTLEVAEPEAPKGVVRYDGQVPARVARRWIADLERAERLRRLVGDDLVPHA